MLVGVLKDPFCCCSSLIIILFSFGNGVIYSRMVLISGGIGMMGVAEEVHGRDGGWYPIVCEVVEYYSWL